MQVNLIKVEGAAGSFDVQVPIDVFAKCVKKAFREVAAKVSVPGYRKGNAPENYVWSRHKGQIDEKSANMLVNDSIQEASAKIVEDHKLTVIPSSVVITSFDVNEDNVIFKFDCEVLKEVEPKDLKHVNVELVKINVTDADVDSILDKFREQHAKWEVEEDGVATNESLVNINFLGKKDGEPFKGGDATNFNLVINSGRMVPGFSESIVGHKAGDSFTVEITFPENYPVAELAGAQSTFDITVNSVSKKILPELNDEFLKNFGFEEKGLEAFKESLMGNLKAQAEEASVNANLKNLYEAIVNEYADLVVPDSLITNELERVFGKGKKSNMDEAQKKRLFENFKPYAEGIIKEQMIIPVFMKASGKTTEPTEEEIAAQIEKTSIYYDDPEEFKTKVRGETDLFNRIKESVYKIKSIDILSSLLNCTTAEYSFDEFSKKNSQN